MLLTDPIAEGIYNYHFFRKNTPIIIHADGFDDDEVLPSYFFRSVNEMPFIEQEALKLAKGKVLDVGACAGCHASILQNKGLEVYALERSELCCKVMEDRKIRNIIHSDLFTCGDQTFDTILLLMNGTGIAGTLNNLDNFLIKLKSLLSPNGQILIDSSDLIYLYTDEDGSAEININDDHYYGELVFQTEYNGKKGNEFPWLYVDQDTLKAKAEENNLRVEKIIEGDHFDYLAIIKHK